MDRDQLFGDVLEHVFPDGIEPADYHHIPRFHAILETMWASIAALAKETVTGVDRLPCPACEDTSDTLRYHIFDCPKYGAGMEDAKAAGRGEALCLKCRCVVDHDRLPCPPYDMQRDGKLCAVVKTDARGLNIEARCTRSWDHPGDHVFKSVTDLRHLDLRDLVDEDKLRAASQPLVPPFPVSLPSGHSAATGGDLCGFAKDTRPDHRCHRPRGHSGEHMAPLFSFPPGACTWCTYAHANRSWGSETFPPPQVPFHYEGCPDRHLLHKGEVVTLPQPGLSSPLDGRALDPPPEPDPTTRRPATEAPAPNQTTCAHCGEADTHALDCLIRFRSEKISLPSGPTGGYYFKNASGGGGRVIPSVPVPDHLVVQGVKEPEPDWGCPVGHTGEEGSPSPAKPAETTRVVILRRVVPASPTAAEQLRQAGYDPHVWPPMEGDKPFPNAVGTFCCRGDGKGTGHHPDCSFADPAERERARQELKNKYPLLSPIVQEELDHGPRHPDDFGGTDFPDFDLSDIPPPPPAPEPYDHDKRIARLAARRMEETQHFTNSNPDFWKRKEGEPPNSLDCKHGYLDGLGCAFCADPDLESQASATPPDPLP